MFGIFCVMERLRRIDMVRVELFIFNLVKVWYNLIDEVEFVIGFNGDDLFFD